MTVRKFSSLLFVNFVVLAGLLLLVELGSRLVFGYYEETVDFRLSQPAPYKNAPYFSEEFVNESFEQPGGWEVMPDTGLVYPNNFKGKYFTVENRRRRTTDVPPGTTRKIYLYGGSTVYSSEVPDEHTIASYLQRALVANGYVSYQVINEGVTSINTNQQLERLRRASIERNDVVIFYDGVNDVIQGVIFGNPGSTMAKKDMSRPKWQRTMLKIANKSCFVRKILGRMVKNYKVHDLENRVSETASRYRENLDSAEKIARDRGAGFLHFLQPNLYSLSEFGDYENALVTSEIVIIQAEAAFKATYPYLERVMNERSRDGYNEFNLKSVFDGIGSPVYLDFCHVNHVGNEKVASAIFAGAVQSGVLEFR